MKTIHLNGAACVAPLRGSGDRWYWATDYTNGDLYEAEELFRDGGSKPGNRLYLICCPDGTVYEPVPQANGRYLGEPIYDNGSIAILVVDFVQRNIHILHFVPETAETTELARLPLSIAADCYNLRLHQAPLLLARQDSGSYFEILWPQRSSFPIGETESFSFREGDKLYFSVWFEDPAYREETLVRTLLDGTVLERFPGSIWIMPSGEKWLLQ